MRGEADRIAIDKRRCLGTQNGITTMGTVNRFFSFSPMATQHLLIGGEENVVSLIFGHTVGLSHGSVGMGGDSDIKMPTTAGGFSTYQFF